MKTLNASQTLFGSPSGLASFGTNGMKPGLLDRQPEAREFELSTQDLENVSGGALIATEFLFVATILVLGVVTGWSP